MSARLSLAAAVAVVALSGAATPAAGQLSERVGAEEGWVRFGYAARPDVEVCDQGIRVGDSHMMWRSNGRGERATGCRYGFVEVDVRVRDGRVTEVELVRRDRRRSVADLGEVDPGEASAWLFGLARGDATSDAAEDAILPATLADVGDTWPELVDIARDRGLDRGVRKNALFWLGQEAAEAVTDDLSDVAMDESEDQGVRNAAIFALSQRDDDASVPVLMDIARTGDEAETRKQAMFWLAQSDDPRVIRFFEDILLGRSR
jgi:hypothetical protein